ncbi:MAG: hypothetical protein R3F60_30270 [bacterium]
MRPPVLLIALASLASGLAGCGYGLVRPDAVAVPTVGVIQDLSADGELGLVAAARLRQRGEGHPPAPGLLEGRVTVGPERTLGRDAAGLSALYQADVALDLEVASAGEARWRARTQASATWVRGSDPLATTTARQLALADATAAAVDAAWDRFVAGSTP